MFKFVAFYRGNRIEFETVYESSAHAVACRLFRPSKPNRHKVRVELVEADTTQVVTTVTN
jgi:hypothetical protein